MNLFPGVAFDNYDQFIETLTGKDPLRDTVGMAFQDLFEGLQVNPEAEDGNEDEMVKHCQKVTSAK